MKESLRHAPDALDENSIAACVIFTCRDGMECDHYRLALSR
jgi:hypothetical protein